MRVGIDVRAITGYTTGLKSYVLYLLKDIQSNCNVYLCYTDKKTDLLKNFNLRKAWGSVENHIIGDIWEQIWLPIALKQDSINVYHGTIGRLPLLKPNNIVYIVTIHDLIPMKFNKFGSNKYNQYMSIIMKHSAKRADKIIAVSQNTKKDIVELLKIPEEKIEVIYEGVSNIFHPVNFEKSLNIVKKHYNKITKRYILATGTVETRKNLKRLFLAYSMLRKKGIEHQLVVVGPEGWGANIVHKIDAQYTETLQKEIIFTGYVNQSELIYLYNAADLFVFPSLYEGFGLPLLEAMACNTPVVASNTSSMPEVVGDAALLFDPLNVEWIADSMEKVLTDNKLREDLRNRGLERVKLFSWEKTARKTLNLYRKVYENRN
ncbi:MAG: glycosyltransferase family 1 protein [bacterium]|nr:glycosyltransferase family 1 protein [bacterium]